MLATVRRLMPLRRGRQAATAIEYGLIAAFIVVGIIGVLQATGGDLEAVFGRVGNSLTGTKLEALGTFENVTPSLSAYFCISHAYSYPRAYPYSVFQSGGTAISRSSCGEISQSTLYSDLSSNTLTGDGSLATMTNINNNQFLVQPLQGPGTGFTVPAKGWVDLYKKQSGSAISFGVHSYGFNSSNLASPTAACAAEGGTLKGVPGQAGSEYACYGGTLYTGTEIAAILPPQ